MSLNGESEYSDRREMSTGNTVSTSGVSSHQKTSESQGKLELINQQLAEVRKKLADRHTTIKRPIINRHQKRKENIEPKKKSPKKVFHHPKLDFVLGEVVYSPYMTRPLDPYPQETFEVPKKLHELRKKIIKGDDVSKEELPYDIAYVTNRFIKEVANFSVSFNMSPEERSPVSTARSGRRSPLSRPSSPDNTFCVDDSSLLARSSIASTESLPPIQTLRKVPSSNGMRSNNLKAKSCPPSTGSSTAESMAGNNLQQNSTSSSSKKPSSQKIESRRREQTGITKEKIREKSDHRKVDTPTSNANGPDLSVKLSSDDNILINSQLPGKKSSGTAPVSFDCHLSQNDLELMMGSFARISHLMGR